MKKSKQFFFYILIFLLILLLSIFLIGKKNKHPLYLEIRSIIINKIDNIKNSSIFKNYFIRVGLKEAKKNFKNIRFEEKRKILFQNFLLNKDQVKISEIKQIDLETQINKSINLLNYERTPDHPDIIRAYQSTPFNLSFPAKNSKIFKVSYYNINHYGIFEESLNKSKKNKLIIYAQGHLGNPYNKKYFVEIKKYFKKKGYDFFSLSMIGKGFNYQGNVKYPNTTDRKQLVTYNHENIKYFYDKNFPEKKPVSIFLSGNYFLVKNLLLTNKYDKIIFIGASGGGWYGKILPSLIDEIDTTYIFNGSAPLYLQIFIDTKGDWESYDKELYDKINYWQFYKMATTSKKNHNKELVLVYNKSDKCCYRDPTASIMYEISKKLNYDKFRVLTYDRKKFHGANLDLLIKDLDLK